MNKNLIILVFFQSLIYLVTNTKHDSIWPYPQKIQTSNHYWIIDSTKFQLNLNSHCDIIKTAIDRYTTERFFIQDCSRLDPHFKGKHFHDKPFVPANNDVNHMGTLSEINIHFNGKCESKPYLNMSESYQITIGSKGTESSIHSSSVWGVLRALETLSQMFQNIGPNQYRINVAQIDDHPRFPHRGMLIDTGRHYLSVNKIFEMLDSMEMNKMNVLHWHIVDDQSFPFVSETFPQLAHKGAFNPKTHIYTKVDVQSVIDYAHLRGIRVMVEIDTPGHTKSWGKGLPEVISQCYQNHHPYNGDVLDPSKEITYETVGKLFKEIATRFPEQYVHLGGDEVNFFCWSSNPQISKFVHDKNMTNFKQLESYYIQRLVKIIEQLNKSYIVWQEVFDDNVILKPDTVVHVWKRKNWQVEMAKVTKKGFTTLLSAPWYLNVISYKTDWMKFYDIDPLDFEGNDEQKRLVLGGEGAMWGEWVDGSNLISRTWPRAITVAEKLWSNAKMNSSAAAVGRFHDQHCRMQQRGIRAEPVDGPGLFCACDHAL